MSEINSYVEQLEARLDTIQDAQTLRLVKLLIQERNYLAKVANIDSLTGLHNRRILGKIRECSAVVMCDIDDFKQVNDSYGHATGDAVIRKVAQIILNDIRETDYVCRIGGDEFFMAFVNCPEEIVFKRLEQIRQAASEEVDLPDPNAEVTMSFGFACKDGFDRLEDMIRKADMALYESKVLGKNQITKYEEQKTKKLGTMQ